MSENEQKLQGSEEINNNEPTESNLPPDKAIILNENRAALKIRHDEDPSQPNPDEMTAAEVLAWNDNDDEEEMAA